MALQAIREGTESGGSQAVCRCGSGGEGETVGVVEGLKPDAAMGVEKKKIIHGVLGKLFFRSLTEHGAEKLI